MDSGYSTQIDMSIYWLIYLTNVYICCRWLFKLTFIDLNFFSNKKLGNGTLFAQLKTDISPCSKKIKCIYVNFEALCLTLIKLKLEYDKYWNFPPILRFRFWTYTWKRKCGIRGIIYNIFFTLPVIFTD